MHGIPLSMAWFSLPVWGRGVYAHTIDEAKERFFDRLRCRRVFHGGISLFLSGFFIRVVNFVLIPQFALLFFVQTPANQLLDDVINDRKQRHRNNHAANARQRE